MVEKCIKVIESCKNSEQITIAYNYYLLVVNRLRDEHKKECSKHCMDCEMLELVYDDLLFRWKEKNNQLKQL